MTTALQARQKEIQEVRKPATIKIFIRTKNALDLIRTPGESYNEVLVRLISKVERWESKKYLFP